jgi:hypothetical protein
MATGNDTEEDWLDLTNRIREQLLEGDELTFTAHDSINRVQLEKYRTIVHKNNQNDFARYDANEVVTFELQIVSRSNDEIRDWPAYVDRVVRKLSRNIRNFRPYIGMFFVFDSLNRFIPYSPIVTSLRGSPQTIINDFLTSIGINLFHLTERINRPGLHDFNYLPDESSAESSGYNATIANLDEALEANPDARTTLRLLIICSGTPKLRRGQRPSRHRRRQSWQSLGEMRNQAQRRRHTSLSSQDSVMHERVAIPVPDDPPQNVPQTAPQAIITPPPMQVPAEAPRIRVPPLNVPPRFRMRLRHPRRGTRSSKRVRKQRRD